MGDNTQVNVQYATFGQRFTAALWFDYLVPILMFISGSLLFAFAFGAMSFVAGGIVQLAGIIIIFSLNAVQPYRMNGKTMSKKRKHIKIMFIVNKETGQLRNVQEGDLGKLIVRTLVGWIEAFLIIPVLIPYLVMNSSPMNQRLADKVAGTVVVQYDPALEPEDDVKSPFKQRKETKIGTSSASVTVEPTKKEIIKQQRVHENRNADLIKVVKLIITISTIVIIFAQIYYIIHNIIYNLGWSLFVWADNSSINIGPIFTILKVIFALNIIAVFSLLVALVLLTIADRTETRSKVIPVLIAYGIYSILAMLWVILFNTVSSITEMGAIDGINYNFTFLHHRSDIVNMFAILALVVSIILLNSYLVAINESNTTKISRGGITLAVFLGLYILVIIVNSIILPINISIVANAVLYYLYELFLMLLNVGLLVAFSSILKVRKVL